MQFLDISPCLIKTLHWPYTGPLTIDHHVPLTSRREVESHFLRILSGLGIFDSLLRLEEGVDLPDRHSSSAAWLLLPGGLLAVLLWGRPRPALGRDSLALIFGWLGLGAMGGLGLAGVVIRPAGEETSLFRAGLTGEQGVDLPEEGRDWSLLTGILLGS